MPKKERQTFCAKIKQVDLFGRPISLTHEGGHMFTSKIGAILTVAFGLILLSLGIGGFFAVAVNEIINVSVS